MAAILFSIFEEEKQKIQLGIHHSRIQRPRNRLKRMDTIFYSKMPLTSSFSEFFPSLGHYFLIYICRHLIQNCFLISYYNNISVTCIIIIIIIKLFGNQQLQLPVNAWSLRNMHNYLMMSEHAHRDAVEKRRINDITHVWYRWYDVLPLWKCGVVLYGLYQRRYVTVQSTKYVIKNHI